MGKIASLKKLKPYYQYLPYCSSIRNVGTKTNPIVEKQMLKTYPAYPWIEDGEDHRDEDPVEFIEACAEAGYVTWETLEQKNARIKMQNEAWYMEEHRKLANMHEEGEEE